MRNNLFLLLLIAHLLGDYYLQSESLADKKGKKLGYVFLHSLVYLIIGAVCLVPVFSINFLWYILAYGASHLVIDIIKLIILKKHEETKAIYIIDQALHIVSILVICTLYFKYQGSLTLLPQARMFFVAIGVRANQFFRIVLLLLIIFKPANITFKKIFNNLRPMQEGEQKDSIKAISLGAQIGNMERLLIVVLLLLNQYTAIGLVITGKSVARYNKISAEYYIVGTFFSILAALIPFVLIWGIG